LVLATQEEAIRMARPGVTLDQIHERCVERLAAGMVDLGLLAGPAAARIEDGGYKAYYMHRTSHWLGMDVHDVGDYRITHQSRSLEPGMVFTVEPGLYIDPERETATFHLREYSEDEQLERRLRLGVAAAKKLEEEEKAKVEKIEHPIPKEFRGIGVRIEDDILVTATGIENLTAGTPKTVEEVERACAEAPRLPR
jgi:Xaa-Pro aminopeptidase